MTTIDSGDHVHNLPKAHKIERWWRDLGWRLGRLELDDLSLQRLLLIVEDVRASVFSGFLGGLGKNQKLLAYETLNPQTLNPKPLNPKPQNP